MYKNTAGDPFKKSDFLFCTREQIVYLRRIKDNSLRKAVYYAGLRSDYTHPDSSDWYDRDSERFERLVANYNRRKGE